MRFNVTVEIDWLEDGSLDDEIKSHIVGEIVERISKESLVSVKRDAEKRVSSKIEELVTKTYEGFLSKGVTITNEWGEVKRENVTIYDIIKEKADNWLTRKVDKEGRESNYGADWTRMEWLINHQLDKQTKRMSDEIVKKVSEEIKKYINDSVKASIGEKLVKEIGLENIINGAKGK